MKKTLIFLDDRKYTAEHIWIKPDNESFLIGVSDFAQDQLGEIAYVELPSLNTKYSTNDDFGTIESLKSVNKLFMPLNGKVLEINTTLEEQPTLVNSDCYAKGWIIRIAASDSQDYSTLLSAKQYREFLQK